MNRRMNNVRFSLALFVAVGIFLCLGLGCTSVQEKMKKIAACEKSGDEQSIKTLLKYLKDKDEKIRVEAGHALGARSLCWCPYHAYPMKIGRLNDERVVKALLQSLKDESPRVRSAAAYSLIPYKSPIMVEPLIEALKDTSGKIGEHDSLKPVGSYAAYTLGELKDKRAIEPLANALRSEGKEIRKSAGSALRTLGEEERVKQEIQKLTPFFLDELESESPDIIDRGLYSIGLFRIHEAVTRINELVENGNPKIRASAAHALYYIGNKTSVPALQKALRDPELQVRSEAVGALGRMREKSALPGILNLLQDPAPRVRISALYAVRDFDEPEIYPPLVQAVWDDDGNVARTAIVVVGEQFNRNQGNPQSHKDIVPRVIQLMERMSWRDSRRKSAIKILVAVEDESALSEIYEAFQRRKVKGGLFIEDQLLIKMATFMAKLGSDGQKEEAIEWLKKVSTQNSNKDNRRYAAEALKELGVIEE